jgi:hypothetical protein
MNIAKLAFQNRLNGSLGSSFLKSLPTSLLLKGGVTSPFGIFFLPEAGKGGLRGIFVV